MIGIQPIEKIMAGAILQRLRTGEDSPTPFQTVVVVRLAGGYAYLLTTSGLKVMPLDKVKSLWDVSIFSSSLYDLLVFMDNNDCFKAIRRQYQNLVDKCLTIDEDEFNGILPHWE